MTDELKQEMTEKFNSAYGEEVKIGLREALRKVYIDGCEHGYQYAVEKACAWLKQHSFDYLVRDMYDDWTYDYETMISDIRKAMED